MLNTPGKEITSFFTESQTLRFFWMWSGGDVHFRAAVLMKAAIIRGKKPSTEKRVNGGIEGMSRQTASCRRTVCHYLDERLRRDIWTYFS